ncbi:MAG TPA: hypothetical protein VK009_13605 [Chloroflexota bacterium]|nr:hypothetical protein [Chloroflexota bacterium]
MKTIAAAFDREEDARMAYAQLQDAGVPGDDIGLVLREHTGEYDRHEEFVEGANEWLGAGVGAAVGGVGGWLAGAAAAGAALAIPVVGPVLAIGALAGIVSAAGGTLGWLAGGLAARGMSHDEAKFYQAAVERGGVLMTVHTSEENADRVRAVLQRNHGTEYRAG